MTLHSLSVYCGSSRSFPDHHRQQAARLGILAAKHKVRLVYGGAAIGLMGVLADSCLAHGGEIVGVCPRFIADMGITHKGLTELHIVDDMHIRQNMMRDLSDAALALPGGSGTFDEISESLAWKNLALTDMPLIVLNCANYWQPWRDMLHHAVDHGYMPKESLKHIVFIDDIHHLFEALRWQSKTEK